MPCTKKQMWMSRLSQNTKNIGKWSVVTMGEGQGHNIHIIKNTTTNLSSDFLHKINKKYELIPLYESSVLCATL